MENNKKRKIKFSLFFYILVKATLVPLLKTKYRVKAENKKLARRMKPPYLVIANHVTFFDPVFINTFIPHRIHFLTSKTLLRKSYVRWLLSKAGVIPKTKADSRDMQAVRDMKNLISRKKIVSFFPEGRQTWDGETHPVLASTIKLMKMLDVPVLLAHVRGGYLSKPRWSKVRRKYHISVEYHMMFTKEEVRTLSIEQMSEIFDKKFRYSEYEYQYNTKLPALSENGAEHFEALMYTCPKCGSFISLKSEGNDVWCEKCDYKSSWDGTGKFVPNDSKIPARVSELLDWQRSNFSKLVLSKKDEFLQEKIFSDVVRVQRGKPMEILQPYKIGELRAYSDRFVLYDDFSEETFTFDEIQTMHVTLVNIIEFKKDEYVYRITFDDDKRSAYKYLSIVQILAPDKAELI
ncbi:MAG: 1-acyl-sn-glycerol-3-phosphate acyltransferase [Spirochaetales bacterium]|nr:1-acyl-sn-glycerol-3-phosphate acyltransferase [Spirochaetales bacterium]